MYEIKTILSDFTENEIAEGAELAAAEQVKLTVEKKKKAGDRLTVLTGEMKEEERENLYWNPAKIKAVIDENNGELVETGCFCRTFEETGFACGHITAAIMAYIEKRDGRDALAASKVAGLLAKRTGVEQPYRPGILRKTEQELAALLAETQQSALPQPTAAAGSIQVECILHPGSNVTQAELKAGGSRLYVIKSARDFIQSYLKQGEVTLGKNPPFRSLPETYDNRSRETMEFLSRLYRESEAEYGKHLFSGISGQDSRYLLLSGTDFDRFMETVASEGIYLAGDERTRVVFTPETRELPLQMTKLEFGATLRMESVEKIAETLDYLYWREEKRIYRLSLAKNDTISRMFDLLQKKDELFIGDRDLPAVCREVLPELTSVMAISYEGMEPTAYLPEKPVFEMYLDYPQENMISCRAYARYRDGKYQLFQNEDYQDNRDFAGEHAFAEVLKQFFQSFDEEQASLYYEGEEEGLFTFLSQDIPRLHEMGEVYISDRLNRLRVVPMSSVSVGVSLESGLMELEMKSDSFSREELAELLSSYDRKKKYHRLKNGTFVAYNEEQSAMWSALADCMGYASKKNPEKIRMPLFRALYLDEMLKEREGVTYNRSREYRKLIRRMKSVEDNDFDPPASLEAILRNYQKDGFVWIKTLKTNGFGGILADDMGLGKTLQVLAFLLSEKEEGKRVEAMRTLIVTPASLVYNWKREIEQFVPGLTLCVISGTVAERKEKIQNAAADESIDVWITSYDLLKRDIELYEDIRFANEVVDEAQYIKNQATNASKSVRLVNSSFRLALTGTPIENRLSELWSIFDYLMPGFLFSYARFRREIELPAVNGQDEDAMEKMRGMVHPFILRRLKRDVLKELPDKQEEVVSVELEGEQRRLYDAHVQRLKMYLAKQSEEEFHQSKLEVLAELTKLRQLCCGPELLLEDYHGPNAKLDACMELIHQAIDGGHKLLLFSQFTSMLDEICGRLEADGIRYYRIDGSVKKEDRMERVEAFQSDEVPVFCISLKAGGTGLNLTAADIVIHCDPWWNLAAQNQATDRAHRIGQKHPVNVYQLIAEDTIEQKIRNLQENKHRLAEEVLSGDSIQSILIRKDEVLQLLEG